MSAPAPGLYTCILPLFSNNFYSETAQPIQVKFYMQLPWARATIIYINGPGHMTKIAKRPMILKLVMQHQCLKLYKVYINDDPELTLTNFTARSNLAAYVFEWVNCYTVM